MNDTGADLEGAHPAHAPLFALIRKTKKYICAPWFSLIICTVAPPGSIFSGSAPAISHDMEKKRFHFLNLSIICGKQP